MCPYLGLVQIRFKDEGQGLRYTVHATENVQQCNYKVISSLAALCRHFRAVLQTQIWKIASVSGKKKTKNKTNKNKNFWVRYKYIFVHSIDKWIQIKLIKLIHTPHRLICWYTDTLDVFSDSRLSQRNKRHESTNIRNNVFLYFTFHTNSKKKKIKKAAHGWHTLTERVNKRHCGMEW